MIGASLEDGLDAAAIAARALEEGLIVNPPRPDTLRPLPPLTIGDAEVDRAVEILAAAVG